jgi:hypothetical protein
MAGKLLSLSLSHTFAYNSEVKKHSSKPGVVVHAYIPSTWEAEFEASMGCIERPCLKKREKKSYFYND